MEKKEILYEHFGSELTESILNMTINDTKKVSEIVEKMNIYNTVYFIENILLPYVSFLKDIENKKPTKTSKKGIFLKLYNEILCNFEINDYFEKYTVRNIGDLSLPYLIHVETNFMFNDDDRYNIKCIIESDISPYSVKLIDEGDIFINVHVPYDMYFRISHYIKNVIESIKRSSTSSQYKIAELLDVFKKTTLINSQFEENFKIYEKQLEDYFLVMDELIKDEL